MSCKLLFVAILFLGVTTTWGASEEDSKPLKISKNLYPKKYLPMDLTKFRAVPTEVPSTTSTSTSKPDTTGSTTEGPSTVTPEEIQEIQLEDLTTSEEEQFKRAMTRTRKSASTTFCVEIRPSNPYQKPFQVCEPSQQQYGYGPKPKPVYYRKPSYGTRPQPQPYRLQPQPQAYHPAPQSGYHVAQSGYKVPQAPPMEYAPSYPQKSGYQAPVEPQSGYQAPQQAHGGYQAPQQPQSGYQAPQQSHSGYQAPQQPQSGYQAPQQPQTGYQVPQQPQSGYQVPQQPQGGYQVPQQPQGGYEAPVQTYQPQTQESGYVRPVMVLPHVPVAEPYHVPKPSYKPSAPVYRSSNGGWDVEDLMAEEIEDNIADNARTAYYNEEYAGAGGYEGKTNIYDMHKKKEISYLPIITHTYTKSKPLKYLKVLKDMKKGYYRPPYYQEQEPEYGHQESNHQESGHQESSYGHGGSGSGSSHGLVITCQPSATGYSGQQNQVELAKHMQLLNNIYSKTESLYNQEALSDSAGQQSGGGYQQSSGGYVAPPTYRNSGGWKGHEERKSGGWSPAEGERKSGDWNAVDGERKSGGYNGAEGERKSGGWSPAEGERKSGGWSPAEGERKSGGWSPAEGERKSGGWSPAEGERKSGGGYNGAEGERKSGGGYNAADGERKSGGYSKAEAEANMRHSKGGKYNPVQMENVGMTLQSSNGPSPTAGMMSQSDRETTLAFQNQQDFA